MNIRRDRSSLLAFPLRSDPCQQSIPFPVSIQSIWAVWAVFCLMVRHGTLRPVLIGLSLGMLAIPALTQGGEVLKFVGNNRVHAQWNYQSATYTYQVRRIKVGGGMDVVVAAGKSIVGSERLTDLPPGDYKYVLDYSGPNSSGTISDEFTIPGFSGTMLFDESYSGVTNRLEGAPSGVTIPEDRTLTFENCNGGITVGIQASGRLFFNQCSNFSPNVTIGANGLAEIKNCTLDYCTGLQGLGQINLFDSRIKGESALPSALIRNCTFEGRVVLSGGDLHFDGCRFYQYVNVIQTDVVIENSVFLGPLTFDYISDPLHPRYSNTSTYSCNPIIRNNSFLGTNGIMLKDTMDWLNFPDYAPAPRKYPSPPIEIGPNYYGDQRGPRLLRGHGPVNGATQWLPIYEYLGNAGAVVEDRKVVDDFPIFDLAPFQTMGPSRKDRTIPPAIWLQGKLGGQNTIAHGAVNAIQTHRPYLLSLDFRGWDDQIGGVEVYAVIGGVEYRPQANPNVSRDLLKTKGGFGSIKHGFSTVNIIVPPFKTDKSSLPCQIYVDTRQMQGYLNPGALTLVYSNMLPVNQMRVARPLQIKVAPWSILCPGYPRNTPDAGPTIAALRRQLPAMTLLRPEDFNLVPAPPGTYRAGYGVLFDTLSTTVLLDKLILNLSQRLAIYESEAPENKIDFFVAVVPHGTLGSAPGMAGSAVNHWYDRRICVVEDSAPEAAIHEIGHGLGLWTGVSGEQYGRWNYPPDGIRLSDVNMTAFSPDPAIPADKKQIRNYCSWANEAAFDVMGCTDPFWFIPSSLEGFSAGLYGVLGTVTASSLTDSPGISKAASPMNALQAGTPTKAAPATPQSAIPPGSHIVLMRGLVDTANRLVIPTIEFIDVSDRCRQLIPPATPLYYFDDYDFEALDASNQVIFSQHFDAWGNVGFSTTNAALGGVPWQATFVVPPGSVRYEIRHPVYQTLFWQSPVASANPLSCQFSSPVSGQTLAGNFLVQWEWPGETASLQSRFFYSVDGGAVWQEGSDWIPTNALALDATFLSQGTNFSFKVVTSDGFRTAEARVDHLLVAPLAPTLRILQPSSGDRADTNQTWALIVDSQDSLDGMLTNVTWTSSRDGVLGSGAVLSAVVLSPGQHVLTATVTNRSGLSAFAQVTVMVAVLTSTDLAITADALVASPGGIDRQYTMPNFLEPGVSNQITVWVRSEGLTNTEATLQIFVTPPQGGEFLLGQGTYSLGPFERATLAVDYVPAVSGAYRFRAQVGDVVPVDSNTANNQYAWDVSCGLGNLLVAIDPTNSVLAGAQWNINGGAWQNSGVTLSNLVSGEYNVSFRVPTGYLPATNRVLQVGSGTTTIYQRLMVLGIGSVQVSITPASAIAQGARWSLDGGPWQTNGALLPNIIMGTHTLSFLDVPLHSTPSNLILTVNNNLLTSTNGAYVLAPQPPDKVAIWSPQNGETFDSSIVLLQWFGGVADGYRVYFGTNRNLGLANLLTNLDPMETYYLISGLAGDTTYFWRIDPTNTAGATIGDVYQFTTLPPGPALLSPSSVTGEDGVPFRYQIVMANTTGISIRDLPPWLTLDLNYVLTGLPTLPTNITVSIVATNATQRVVIPLNIMIKGGPSLTWQSVSSPVTADLHAVTYGKGQYIAVGSAGTIITSPDGRIWTSVASGRTESLNSVAWGSTNFLVAGDGGLILNSADGTHWTALNTGFPAPLTSLIWNNGLWIVTGYERQIKSSINGANWTTRNGGGFNPLASVAYGANAFVAVGGMDWGYPTLMKSPDGLAWTSVDSGTTSDGFFGVVYARNMFVAVGNNGKVMTSLQGDTWVTRSSGANTTWRSIAFSEGVFAAVGNAGNTMTSRHGNEWVATPSSTSRILYGITSGPRQFVAVGAGGAIISAAYAPDTDLDGMSDWKEELAGTDPTNPVSLLKLQPITPPLLTSTGLVLAWPGVVGRFYTLECSTNLASGFYVLMNHIPGESSSFTDTNALARPRGFYRLKVE